MASPDGVFRTMQDLRMKQVSEWMNHSLKQPEPDYSDIKFDLPRAPASQPAPERAK